MSVATREPAFSTRVDSPRFYRGDYDAAFAWLRRNDPVHWQRESEMWVITRHADIRTIANDPGRFSNNYGVTAGSHAIARQELGADGGDGERPWRLAQLRRSIARRSNADQTVDSLQGLDPPAHATLRRVLSGSFTPRVINQLEDRVRDLTRTTLDQVDAGDVGDFMTILAVPVPIYVIAELIGVPKEDRDDFHRWSDVVISAVEPKSAEERRHDQEQYAEMFAYFRAQAEQRRAEPRDDLLTHMVQARVDGTPLPMGLVDTLGKLILSAGNETTRSGIAGAVLALVQHPTERAALLADPTRIDGAVNEFLRWTTPVRAFCRTATEDVEFGGKLIRRGDFLVLSYVSANRDEDAWADASRFDVGRKVAPGHLAFGHGPHICIGQTLARIELKVVIEELLARFPACELAGEPVELVSSLVHGFQSMPVRFA